MARHPYPMAAVRLAQPVTAEQLLAAAQEAGGAATYKGAHRAGRGQGTGGKERGFCTRHLAFLCGAGEGQGLAVDAGSEPRVPAAAPHPGCCRLGCYDLRGAVAPPPPRVCVPVRPAAANRQSWHPPAQVGRVCRLPAPARIPHPHPPACARTMTTTSMAPIPAAPLSPALPPSPGGTSPLCQPHPRPRPRPNGPQAWCPACCPTGPT